MLADVLRQFFLTAVSHVQGIGQELTPQSGSTHARDHHIAISRPSLWKLDFLYYFHSFSHWWQYGD